VRLACASGSVQSDLLRYKIVCGLRCIPQDRTPRTVETLLVGAVVARKVTLPEVVSLIGEQPRRKTEQEIAMNGTNALVALAAAAAITLGAASATPSDHGSGRERGGAVRPCSLDGVNPAYHPDIFGNPGAARSFGFVLGPDRVWRVRRDCSPLGRY
jgi:hypothetical protein